VARSPHDQEVRNPPERRGGRGLLIVFYALFGLFTLNILLGKARLQFGWDVPFLLSDVAEFLLLLAAAAVLMLAALRRQEGAAGGDS